MEPGKLNYARKGSMKDELSDTESKKVNVIGSLIDTNDENEKIIKSEEFSGEEEFADVKIGQDRTNAKKNENSHKNEGNSPTNANEIENYEDQKKLDPERDLMKNEDVFVKVGNNDPLSKEDLVGVPEQEDVLCKDDNFQEVEMVKTVREDEISQRGELLGDELCFSNEGVENAEVILGNVENEEITLGENGKQMIVNEFISEKEDNDREDIPKRFSENDGKKKICDNQGTEEVSQPGGDDNAGDDEGKGRDDNLTQRDDTIVTDDTIDRKEKELYEREKYSEAGERVDDGQNNLTETGEDRRIWESLPKREDEIVKDDSWNKFCERGSRSEIGEEVDDVRDTFTGENEERRMYDDHPKGEGLKIGDNSIRKIENEVCEQESSSQNEEVVDDARNAATEKGEDLRLCDSFLKDSGGDNFECSRKDLNESEQNFPDEKEVDRKGVNFIGSDQIKSDEIERDDVIEQTEEDMRMDKSTSIEKEMCGEQHVLSGIEDPSDELDRNEFRRSSGDGRIDRNLTDSNFMEEGSHYQEDGEDNFVKQYEPFESPSNVYEKGDETVTLEMDVYAGQNSFPENFVEIRMCENLSKRDGDDEIIRSGIDDKNKERLSSRKSNFGEKQEDYWGIYAAEGKKDVPCDRFLENKEFPDEKRCSRNDEQDVFLEKEIGVQSEKKSRNDKEDDSSERASRSEEKGVESEQKARNNKDNSSERASRSEGKDVESEQKPRNDEEDDSSERASRSEKDVESKQKSRNDKEDDSSECASRSKSSRKLHDDVKSEKNEIRAREYRPEIENYDVEVEKISEDEKYYSEHQDDLKNHTDIINGRKLSGRDEQGVATENCFIKVGKGSELEDSSERKKVDIDPLSKKKNNRKIDGVSLRDKVKLAYNATSENNSEVLKLYWGNERKETKEKTAAEKEGDIKKDNFSNQEGVPRKDLNRKVEAEIHDVNRNDKHIDNRNYLLPHKKKLHFKSTTSLPVEDWEMASVEEYASVELKVSNDQLEEGCSGIRKTEIVPVEIEDFRISNDEEEDGLFDKEGDDEVEEEEEEEEDTYDFQFTSEFCTTFMAFFSVVGYVGDLVSDLVVSYFWFHDGHPLWGGLSLFFALFPTLILNWMSYSEMKSQRALKRSLLGIEQKPWVWKITVASHFLLLGPFIRYSKHFLFMFPLHKKAIILKNTTMQEMAVYTFLLKLESIALTNMALTEGFMESAPQLILQIYTMSLITDDTKGQARVIAQIASMVFSLFKLSWSVTNFHTTKRILPKENKFGTVFNFLWQVNTFASRVVSLALFATIFPKSCLTVCCCHAAAASAWIAYHMYIRKNETPLSVFTIKKLGPVLSVLVIGVIHVFCYPEHGVGPRRYRLLAYYLIVGVENAVFITLWFVYVDDPQEWLKTLAFVAVYVCYVVGIASMIVYYRFFHFNVLEHPERWKMKILFPKKEDGDKKEEEDSSNEGNVNEDSDNEGSLNEDSGKEDGMNDSSIIYIDEDLNSEDNVVEDSMKIT